jgi:AcrR family transcriptional regulator
MEKTDAKRQMIIEKAADHLLLHGLKGATLRKLAVTAGMSDRMLMHYFTNKEELLQAALTVLTSRLVNLLESSRTQPMPFEKFLPYLVQMMKHPRVRPFLRLSLELAALTAEGESSYVVVAQKICNDFYLWMASAMLMECEQDRLELAALAFATTEGFMVLDALGSGSIVDSALKGLTVRSPAPI